VIRTISTAPRPETFSLDGHRFFWENRYVPAGASVPESSPIDAIHPFSSLTNGDPATPILRAYAGDPVRVHAIGAPGSEQVQTLGLGGLTWPFDPFIPQTEAKFSRGLGPYEKVDANLIGGAGGVARAVGDFAYSDRRLAYVEAGMWGLLRVLSDPACPIRPLDGLGCSGQPPLR